MKNFGLLLMLPSSLLLAQPVSEQVMLDDEPDKLVQAVREFLLE